MPVVTMPDGQLVDMPDSPTPEQLEGLKKLNSLPREIGRVADKTFRGGLAATPGMIGDVALSAVRNLHQGEDAFPGANQPGMLPPHLLALRLLSEVGKTAPVQNTKFGDVTKQIETVGGALPPKSEPTTSGGKAVANVLEPAVATVAGGGAGTFWDKLLIGLGGGAGGETAARFFGDNALTRGLGSLVGGGAAAVGTALKPNATNIVRDATEHITPNDWRRAKVMEATLEKEGIPHLKSQLLGPRSTLADTVAVAGTNPSVRPKLVTAVEGAETKARQAVERSVLTNLPASVDERAAALHDIQGASEAAIQVLKNKARTAYKGQLPPEDAIYPKEYVQAIHEALTDLAKSPKYGITSDAGKAIIRLADDLMLPGGKVDVSGVNPTVLLRAKQSGADLATLPGAKVIREPVTNQHQINNLIKELNLKATGETYKHLPLENVKAVLKDLTPEFTPARDAMTKVYTNEVNPAQRGLTGQLAQMGGGMRPDKSTAKETALGLVFPQDRLQPQAIVDLSKQIGGEGVGALLREHLARNLERTASLKPTVGEAVQGPYKFVEAVAGTNAQRQNLEAALKVNAEAMGANPAAVRNGFYKLMKALETTKDLKLPAEVDRAALAQQAGKTLPGFAVAPNSRIGRSLWERATAKTYNQIADMVLSKDGLAKLEAIARSERPETARQFAISVLTSANAGEEK